MKVEISNDHELVRCCYARLNCSCSCSCDTNVRRSETPTIHICFRSATPRVRHRSLFRSCTPSSVFGSEAILALKHDGRSDDQRFMRDPLVLCPPGRGRVSCKEKDVVLGIVRTLPLPVSRVVDGWSSQTCKFRSNTPGGGDVHHRLQHR
jgi:hypothetical protein